MERSSIFNWRSCRQPREGRPQRAKSVLQGVRRTDTAGSAPSFSLSSSSFEVKSYFRNGSRRGGGGGGRPLSCQEDGTESDTDCSTENGGTRERTALARLIIRMGDLIA